MRIIKRPFQKFGQLVRGVSWRTFFRDYTLMTLGALIIAFNINMFLGPAKIPDGTLLAAGLIGNHLFGFPIGITMLALRVPALIIGFIYLGRWRFLIRTAWVVIVMTAGIDVLAPFLGAITDNQFLNMLYGAILGGIGGGLIYRSGGTTGGTGVFARVIQRFRGLPLSEIYIFVDGIGLVAAGFFFGWEASLLGGLAIFINGMVADFTMEGPSVVRTATIVTDKPEEVSEAILGHLHRGVTAWQVEGMYTHHKRTMLFCTIARPEVHGLRTLVQEIDPKAFLVIGQGHRSSGGVVRGSQK